MGFSWFLIIVLFFPASGICGQTYAVKPVDKVVLLELYGDNNYPVGKSDRLVQRLGDIRQTGRPYPPLEARGMGTLVEITAAGKTHTILFDSGSRGDVMRNNFSYFHRNPADIEAIVVSHGHSDHFGGLGEVLKMIREQGNNRNIPIHVGSREAFESRYFRQKNGDLKGPWKWPREEVEQLGGRHVVTGKPELLLGGLALYTGPIPRIVPYEKMNLKKKKGWCVKEKDGTVRMINMPEDSALVVHVKNRGLVVISGCTHSGVTNTLRYARQLTEVGSVYARFGSYPKEDPAKLIKDLLEIKPVYFIGAHCSPNRPDLMYHLRHQLPENGIHYYQSVIGSKFTFLSH
ncbi:MAG: MBL fold metallo-hydrolase [bacterium]